MNPKSSGQKTASAVITGAPGLLYGIIVTGLAAAASVIDLFDHATAASGTRMVPQVSLIATTDNDRRIAILFPVPVEFFNGLYLSITTSAGTANVVVYYQNKP